MRALDGLHVEEALTLLLADGRIPAVGERTGDAVAVARDVVRVAAEGLFVLDPVQGWRVGWWSGGSGVE